MYKKIILAALAVLILTACGRKEAPQVIADAPPPAIVAVEHMVTGNTLKISVRLTGGSGGIGYQIDRAEMDPHCQCPSFWRRFVEESPHPKNADQKLSQMIRLANYKRAFVFRIRAVDGLGRLGSWSKPIQAQAEEFFK